MKIRSLAQLAILLVASLPAAAAPLVSNEQVQSARNKAILWTVFAAVMVGICIFQLVRYFRKK